MRTTLLRLTICAGLAFPAARAAASDPPKAAPAEAAEADPADAAQAAQLKQAEADYDEGVRLLKAEKLDEGRAKLKKAFDAVIANLEEDTLPASLRADFAGMLDKIRNWDGPPEDGEDPSGLDVPDAALK